MHVNAVILLVSSPFQRAVQQCFSLLTSSVVNSAQTAQLYVSHWYRCYWEKCSHYALCLKSLKRFLHCIWATNVLPVTSARHTSACLLPEITTNIYIYTAPSNKSAVNNIFLCSLGFLKCFYFRAWPSLPHSDYVHNKPAKWEWKMGTFCEWIV